MVSFENLQIELVWSGVVQHHAVMVVLHPEQKPYFDQALEMIRAVKELKWNSDDFDDLARFLEVDEPFDWVLDSKLTDYIPQVGPSASEIDSTS